MRPSMQIHFFASRRDLEQVFAELEEGRQLAYIDISPGKSSLDRYTSFAHIVHAGFAPHVNAIAGHMFLIVPPEFDTSIFRRSSASQITCPDSVVLMPGGRWHNDVILYGKIGSNSSSDFSRDLYRTLVQFIKRRFKSVQSYWVGPEAYALGQTGVRLTISGDSPTDFDLQLPE